VSFDVEPVLRNLLWKNAPLARERVQSKSQEQSRSVCLAVEKAIPFDLVHHVDVPLAMVQEKED
jgi:hypothetical protein